MLIAHAISRWNRKRVAALGVFLTALAVVLAGLAMSGSTATAGSTQGAGSDLFAGPIPAAGVEETTAVPLAAGSNQIGWIGFPTTSTAILGGNSAITTIWLFVANGQIWSSDSTTLPMALRTALSIGPGTGMFLIASSATQLIVVTKIVSSTQVTKNFGEVEFWLDMTNPSDDTTAVLTRTPGGLHMQIETNDLPAGAYTGWWRIFNNPAACVDPLACTPGDDREASRWIVVWATGFVVGDNRIGSAQAFLGVGFDALPDSYPDIAEDNFQLLGGTIERGGFLDNPGGAAVDFVLKWHGEVDPDADIFFDQVHNQVGSCEQFEPQGNFGCVDIQRTVINNP